MLGRAVPVVLGASAGIACLAVAGIDVILAITLLPHASVTHAHILSMAGAVLEVIAVAVLMVTLVWQWRQYTQPPRLLNVRRGRRHTYLFIGTAAACAVLAAGASGVALAMVLSSSDRLPAKMYSIATKTLVTIGFAIWAASLIAHVLFWSVIFVIQRRDSRRQAQEYQAESLPQIQPRMVEANRPRSQSAPDCTSPRETSMDPESSPGSCGKSRPGSAQSYSSKVVRPMNSKTRLIPGHRHLPHHKRAPSLDSAHQYSPGPVEDGFDSWDTSTVDPPTRQAVEEASPTPGHTKYLETIPQSPTDVTVATQSFELGLNPPRTRKRSRSFSPASNRFREGARTPRASSPADSTRNSQANIHPLFRIDSPTPPPCTPGTMVTAAPGAGRVISDRQSVKSIHRMRSGSLPSSPLMHSTSSDNIRRDVEKDSQDGSEEGEAGIERRLTPPIPDWIMGAGPRGSDTYASWKPPSSPPVGLGIGIVGEAL